MGVLSGSLVNLSVDHMQLVVGSPQPRCSESFLLCGFLVVAVHDLGLLWSNKDHVASNK